MESGNLSRLEHDCGGACATDSDMSYRGGFTLLEVMVTMLLIGIVTSLALIVAPGQSNAERLAAESERLAALIAINLQEAMLLSEQRGVRVGGQSYQAVRRTIDGRWQPVGEYPARQLPPGMSIQGTLQGRPMTLAMTDTSTARSVAGTARDRPQIVLLSSGEATDFELTFGLGGNASSRLAGDGLGRLVHSTEE